MKVNHPAPPGKSVKIQQVFMHPSFTLRLRGSLFVPLSHSAGEASSNPATGVDHPGIDQDTDQDTEADFCELP